MILATIVLFVGGLLAIAWYYGQASDQGKRAPAPGKIETATVLNQVSASNTHPTQVTAPVLLIPDIIHADIYFEVGRKGLTDEGKAQSSSQADMLNQHEDYGVLIQGYTDQQGSASYNKQLGMKRAEAVKAELVTAGIAEHRIKTVSLGEEGVLCVDGSDVCRHMNRRVHLEVRKIGQEHMVLPPAPVTTSESSESPIDPSSTMEDSDSATVTVPSVLSDPTLMLEPVSGS
jgi:peptidoglycan-associated lipoprotein